MKIDFILNGKKGFVFFTNEEDGKQDVLMADTAQYLFFDEVEGKAVMSSREEPTGFSICSYTESVEKSREVWDYFIEHRFEVIDIDDLSPGEKIFVMPPSKCIMA